MYKWQIVSFENKNYGRNIFAMILICGRFYNINNGKSYKWYKCL